MISKPHLGLFPRKDECLNLMVSLLCPEWMSGAALGRQSTCVFSMCVNAPSTNAAERCLWNQWSTPCLSVHLNALRASVTSLAWGLTWHVSQLWREIDETMYVSHTLSQVIRRKVERKVASSFKDEAKAAKRTMGGWKLGQILCFFVNVGKEWLSRTLLSSNYPFLYPPTCLVYTNVHGY